MKKLIASLILLCGASVARAQIIDFAYHLTASAYPLDGGVAGSSGSGVGPYSGTPVLGDMIYFDGTNWVSLAAPANGAYNVTWTTSVPSWTAATAGAPTNATYITQVAEAGLSAEQALGSLATGFMKSATTTGVVSTQPTIALTDLATQATKTFVMNNATSTAAPTAVTTALSQQSVLLDPQWAILRDEMCTVGGIFRSSATGGGTATQAAADAARPCLGSLNTGTGTSDAFQYVMTDASANDNIKLGGGAIVMKANINVPIVSDGTNTFTVRFGLMTSKASQTDGVYVEYTHSLSSGNWRFCGSKASASSCSDSTISAGTATPRTIEIDINAGGTTADLFIDGVSRGSQLTSTNLPTAAVLFEIDITKSAGGSSRSIFVDYVMFAQQMTAAR